MTTERAKEVLVTFLIALWAVFTPIHTLLYIVSALVGVDLFTGVFRAWRNKKPITSERWRHSTAKLLGYYILLGVGLGLDTALGGDGQVMARAIAVTICIGEGLSIDENVSPTTGISIKTVLNALVDRLKPPAK